MKRPFQQDSGYENAGTKRIKTIDNPNFMGQDVLGSNRDNFNESATFAFRVFKFNSFDLSNDKSGNSHQKSSMNGEPVFFMNISKVNEYIDEEFLMPDYRCDNRTTSIGLAYYMFTIREVNNFISKKFDKSLADEDSESVKEMLCKTFIYAGILIDVTSSAKRPWSMPSRGKNEVVVASITSRGSLSINNYWPMAKTGDHLWMVLEARDEVRNPTTLALDKNCGSDTNSRYFLTAAQNKGNGISSSMCNIAGGLCAFKVGTVCSVPEKRFMNPVMEIYIDLSKHGHWTYHSFT